MIALSLTQLTKEGPISVVATAPEIQQMIRGSEIAVDRTSQSFLKLKSRFSSEQDTTLLQVVGSVVENPEFTRSVADGLVLGGQAKTILDHVQGVNRALEQYGEYLDVFREYEVTRDKTNFGTRIRFKQPESPYAMVSRFNEITEKKGRQVGWNSLLGILGDYYRKGTTSEIEPLEVIPFVAGSASKPFFGKNGQKAYLPSMGFEPVDFGVDAVATVIDLMDQCFPEAMDIPWRLSRALINKEKDGDKAVVGALSSSFLGVRDNFYYNARARAYVFVAGSPNHKP